MPKFKGKSGGGPFKMKKYGQGKSPLKVSDATVVGAQAKLDKVELDFREPGWSKAAKKLVGGAKDVVKGAIGAGKTGNGGEASKQTVSEILEEKEIAGEDSPGTGL